MAVSVLYVFVFAVASLLPRKETADALLLSRNEMDAAGKDSGLSDYARFLVLYPAYKEDAVIRRSMETFLMQDYPREKYRLTVISDHMQPETNQWLAQQDITLLQPDLENSSKAKALKYAIRNSESGIRNSEYDFVVILDADNIVASDFLTRLNHACGYAADSDRIKSLQRPIAIQCHRTAKNADNSIAVLDGVSEEINNSIFRRGHNRLGLSSALIGSGMCFSYQWFSDHVGHLSTAGEDKELEALLMKEKVFIRYEEDIRVMDEKVSGSDNFQRQRLRWMTAQVQCLFAMLPYVPRAFLTGNINYLDKTLQQALVPRSILLVLTTFMALFSTVAAHLTLPASHFSFLKWWLLLAVLVVGLVMAIPSQMRTRAIFSKVVVVPKLAWRMMKNLASINTRNKAFIHTTHNT